MGYKYVGVRTAGDDYPGRFVFIRRILDRGDWETMRRLRGAVGGEGTTAWFPRKRGPRRNSPHGST